MSSRILFVDDDTTMTEMASEALPQWDMDVEPCRSGEEALARISDAEFSAVVTDLRMGGMDGLELCTQIVENRPDIPVLVITAFGSMETAIRAIRAGAFDFLTKPFEMPSLSLALRRAIEHRELRVEIQRLQHEVGAGRPEAILGRSDAMLKLFRVLDQLEEFDASVLIQGETGTGKELVARELHLRSQRSRHPFVAVSCAAIPANLLESEFFGYVKGSFTGAVSSREGLLRRADKGTLFLDEVGELPLELQGKLLRVLQERRVRPVGGGQEHPFDVRLISATNADLTAEVEAGRFRSDLYFRLNVVGVEVPPLRKRGNDILLLAQHFLDTFADSAGRPIDGFTAETARRLLEYPWPGNVRELQNCLERSVVFATHDQLVVDDLCLNVGSPKGGGAAPAPDRGPGDLESLSQVERRHILRVLKAVEGRRNKAAKILGLDRKTLYHKLKSFEASPAD